MHEETKARIDERAVELVQALGANIAATERLFAKGAPPGMIGTVSGSEAARSFWQGRLDAALASFRAREAISLHEDLPVGQAFGLLLLWQRLRPRLLSGEGALLAFVFGEGSRATPFTEAECGQKPAMSSFVRGPGPGGGLLSIVELALRYFAPVESYLRRSGFDGVVVKWGDEVQIPTRDLSGPDALFQHADVVRFVSMRPMTEEQAASKDWVGVDEGGRVTAFIPRRPLAKMAALADRGLLVRRGGSLHGGVNLGSIALSRALLDLLLEEFEGEVNDPSADRRLRPDLDPQLFTALTVAATEDAAEREASWARALEESETMRALASRMPGIEKRLRSMLGRFEARHHRKVKMVAMDFGDQYWGDVGQHRQIHDFYMALASPGPEGEIARALAGLDAAPDAAGNIVAGATRIGAAAKVRGSVLIDAQVESGEVVDSVLVGTRCPEIRARGAFDVCGVAPRMLLPPRAGCYKVVSGRPVEARAGERLSTVFLPGRELLLRVLEGTDLRDKAATYDVPILGNALSFREAHEMVTRADPALLEESRRRRREELLRMLLGE